MPHIRLQHVRDEVRQLRGRETPLPNRNQAVHGRALGRQLRDAIAEYERRGHDRPRDMPPLPATVQLIIRSATTAAGKPLLTPEDMPKGWRLEVLEERRDGSLVMLSQDPAASRFETAIDNFRRDARTPKGRLKGGSRAVFKVEEVASPNRELRVGDELALVELQGNQIYVIDVEIAAGREHADGLQRRESFLDYLRLGGATVIGNGALVAPDYAAYRARASGALIVDMIDLHPWVISVDLPPVIEQEGYELRDIGEPDLPVFAEPLPGHPVVGVIDSGIIPEHPLIRLGARDQEHVSFISDSIVDEGTDGHGTAICSLVALGSLRRALLDPAEAPTPVKVALARLLDANTLIPEEIVVHNIIAEITDTMLQTNRCRIFNHSVASRGLFNKNRMSLWAEAIDSVAYDEGNDGFLFIIPTGNIDLVLSPSRAQVQTWIDDPGHPDYLLEERCRLRNPAQSINALTVGGYVPVAAATFHNAQAFGQRPLADTRLPSPFTRSGLGFLREVKPEVVEEGGNWYVDEAHRLITRPQHTDVAVANSMFATDGRIIKFASGTSFAAAKVCNLAGVISRILPGAGPDLVRALIVNSAEWPQRLGSAEETLRLLGYGVPNRDRALSAAGARCLLVIEDEIEIGHAQTFRIPFPHDLFEDNPELILRVSVTLSYRAPVRKTNMKYRGTILEWLLSKRDEDEDQFRRRCRTIGVEEEDTGEDFEPEPPPGDWDWAVGTRRRTRGTAQKDWFQAAADQFPNELSFAVLGRRGWLSKAQQDAGFRQRYAAAISIEVLGAAIPIHERIEALVRVPVRV